MAGQLLESLDSGVVTLMRKSSRIKRKYNFPRKRSMLTAICITSHRIGIRKANTIISMSWFYCPMTKEQNTDSWSYSADITSGRFLINIDSVCYWNLKEKRTKNFLTYLTLLTTLVTFSFKTNTTLTYWICSRGIWRTENIVSSYWYCKIKSIPYIKTLRIIWHLNSCTYNIHFHLHF